MKTDELIEILKQYPGADVEAQSDYAAYTTEIIEEDIKYDEGANAVVITCDLPLDSVILFKTNKKNK